MKVAAVKKPGGPGNLVIEDRPDPVAGPGEVLVRIRASSLNYHDFVVVMGGIPTDDGRIPMSDGAGDVVSVGKGVTRFKPGDRVLSTFFPDWFYGGPQAAGFFSVPGDGVDGFAAELVAMPAEAFTHMPADYWTGGVSIFALQFAKAAGARVIATSSSDAKLETLKSLGADHVINYKDTPEWGKKAFELTGGRGVDEVVEIGGPGTMAQSIAACRVGGHISLIGVLTGVSGEVPTAALFSKNITVSGITVGSREHQEAMIAAIDANGIKPVLDKDFPLSEIAAAFAHQASQQHFGKITLSI